MHSNTMLELEADRLSDPSGTGLLATVAARAEDVRGQFNEGSP
jgi:hypothetical protein